MSEFMRRMVIMILIASVIGLLGWALSAPPAIIIVIALLAGWALAP